MNNTKKTRTTLAIVAILTAATLVVGTFATTTTLTQTALAFSKNKKGEENSRNANTITALKCENKGSTSGFDTALDQECENLICTHPGENATCVQEGLATAAVQQGNQTTPVKQTCEECLTKFLSSTQRSDLLRFFRVNSLPDLCARLSSGSLETEVLPVILERLLGPTGAEQLIQCLQDAGIMFPSVRG